MSDQRVFGITGWKNSGKTTLVAALVAEFTSRGLQVSTVKHAHHDFEIDQEGRDSWKHRKAGAKETALVSSRRWALMHELKEEDEPSLDEMLDKLAPCDLVLVEGFKRSGHPKIETIRNAESGRPKQAPVWQYNDSVVAIAASDMDTNCSLRQFHLDSVPEIADFILDHLSITTGGKSVGKVAQSNAQ
ncbi:MAG: molybdopterin-guanine dinucleotide biosynthesis protein B [Pseudomonadota bacterium]